MSFFAFWDLPIDPFFLWLPQFSLCQWCNDPEHSCLQRLLCYRWGNQGCTGSCIVLFWSLLSLPAPDLRRALVAHGDHCLFRRNGCWTSHLLLQSKCHLAFCRQGRCRALSSTTPTLRFPFGHRLGPRGCWWLRAVDIKSVIRLIFTEYERWNLSPWFCGW